MFYLALFSSSKYGVSSMFWARCVLGSYLCMVIKNNHDYERNTNKSSTEKYSQTPA